MLRVFRSSVINAPVKVVWNKIRDFNALSSWLPIVEDSQIEDGLTSDQVGCIRNFNLKDGANIREQLLALDDVEHLFRYSMLSSPLPMTDYIATLRLLPITDGDRSYIEWVAEFNCVSEEADNMMSLVGNGVFMEGFNSLQKLLAE